MGLLCTVLHCIRPFDIQFSSFSPPSRPIGRSRVDGRRRRGRRRGRRSALSAPPSQLIRAVLVVLRALVRVVQHAASLENSILIRINMSENGPDTHY